jgi:hypothetical protein
MTARRIDIDWEDALDRAKEWARKENKSLLLDFTAAPQCAGCAAMDSATYPDCRVAEYIGKHFIPVKIKVRDRPDIAAGYDVNWTPSVLIGDATGRAHFRVEGFMPPEEFIAQLALGLGRLELNRQQLPRAIHHFEEVAERHAGTESAAQALYWLGVCRYKHSKDPAQLRENWNLLLGAYPRSEWAKRADIPKS